MNPVESALSGLGGDGLLGLLGNPVVAALMWALPVLAEIAVAWLLVRAWRRRAARRSAAVPDPWAGPSPGADRRTGSPEARRRT